MPQSVKLSNIHVRNQEAVHTCIPALWRKRQGDRWGLLASQPSLLSELQMASHEQRWRANEGKLTTNL